MYQWTARSGYAEFIYEPMYLLMREIYAIDWSLSISRLSQLLQNIFLPFSSSLELDEHSAWADIQTFRLVVRHLASFWMDGWIEARLLT